MSYVTFEWDFGELYSGLDLHCAGPLTFLTLWRDNTSKPKGLRQIFVAISSQIKMNNKKNNIKGLTNQVQGRRARERGARGTVSKCHMVNSDLAVLVDY